MRVDATPKFFKKTWPGEDSMELEVAMHWDQHGKSSDSVLMFLYKNPDRYSAGSRIRMRITKGEAKILAATLTKFAER
jgi:hypothetical protein